MGFLLLYSFQATFLVAVLLRSWFLGTFLSLLFVLTLPLLLCLGVLGRRSFCLLWFLASCNCVVSDGFLGSWVPAMAVFPFVMGFPVCVVSFWSIDCSSSCIPIWALWPTVITTDFVLPLLSWNLLSPWFRRHFITTMWLALLAQACSSCFVRSENQLHQRVWRRRKLTHR